MENRRDGYVSEEPATARSMEISPRMVFGAFGRRLDFSDRRTSLAASAAGLVAFALVIAFAIGSGDAGLLRLLVAVALAPVLLVVALRWPYVFPAGVYIALVPFDQVLSIPGAGTLTRYLGLASILAVAVYAFRMRRIGRPPLALYLWLAYVGWIAIEMLRSVDVGNGQATLQAAISLVLLFAVFAMAPINERQLRFLCWATIAGGVIAGLYGMYLFHQHPELLAKTNARVTLDLMGQTLDANAFADALLAPFALALVATLNARRAGPLLGSFAAFAIVAAAIVTSLSREALLSCAVIVAVTVWFSRRRLLGALLAIPVFVLLPILVPSLLSRVQDAIDTGGAGRASIWSVDWHAFLQHPLIGWGTGNSIDAYNRNFLAVFQAYNAGWSRPPHNTALFLAVEFGIVGVLLFFGAWFAAFGPLKRIKRGDSLYDLRVGITAALASLLLAGCFVDVSAHKHVWLVFALAAQLRMVMLTRPLRYVR
jgi:O-antigen ligase